MKVFYARVSGDDQNEARQIKIADDLGVEKIFSDKSSGKNTDRPGLQEMLSFVRDGDIVIVESISRLARNTTDFLSIIEKLTSKNVAFCSTKENINTISHTGKFMLTVFAALAELERESILERQREGIAIAKAAGKYKGRKPKQVDEVKFKKACAEWRAGNRTAVSVQREFGITATTFYRWVNSAFTAISS